MVLNPRAAIDHAILFGFDGLRPDSITKTDCPNLYALLEQAIVFARHRSVLPTVTRVNLASLVTGACPCDHGIVANTFFVRNSGRKTAFDTSCVEDLNLLAAMAQGHSVSKFHVQKMLAEFGEHLAVAATGSNGSFNLLSNFQNSLDLAYNPVVHGPVKPRNAGGAVRNMPSEATDHFISHIWPASQPVLSILWFAETDTAGHCHGIGSPEHRAALKQVDAELGRLVSWRDSQPNAERIAIAVASDHGQVSIGSSVSLADWLNSEGFRAATCWENDRDLVLTPGMSPGFWFARRDPGLLQAVVDAVNAQPWSGPLFSRFDEHNDIKGVFYFEDVGLDHPLAPDLMITFRGNDRPNGFGMSGRSHGDPTGTTLTLDSGFHGGLHDTELSCLFALKGKPFPAEYQADMASCTGNIIPTLYKALHPNGKFSNHALPIGSIDGPTEKPVAKEDVRSLQVGSRRYDLHLQICGRLVHADKIEFN